jgi:hypothetical protein
LEIIIPTSLAGPVPYPSHLLALTSSAALSSLLPANPHLADSGAGNLLLDGMAELMHLQCDLLFQFRSQLDELKEIKSTVLKFAKLIHELEPA